MIYKYTSERNFTKILEAASVVVQHNVKHVYKLFSSKCLYYTTIIVYTTVFVPCNLTTGTPRSLCSNACHYFRHFCQDDFAMIIKYSKILGIPILTDDYCENTFVIINKLYHYPNSSKDFDNDCFDFTGNVLLHCVHNVRSL